MKEYAIYPFKNMNISQNWNQGNHIPHWKDSKDHSDKPWDEAGINTGREYFIPQNDFIVEEVLGIDTSSTKGYTNSVRLKSVNKLYIPYKEEADYLYLTLSHMNEDNLREISKGQIIKKNTQLLLEGTDGNATGNHFHITANLGKYYGFKKNSNGSWVFTYDKSLIPEEAFYADRSFTNIIDSKGSIFTDVPVEISEVGNPVSKDETVNQLEVKVSNLRCRNTPSLEGNVIGYIRKGFYNYSNSIKTEDYVWYDVGVGFIAYNENWVTLYPKKVESNDEFDDEQENAVKETFIVKIFRFIIKIIKKIFKIK